MFCLFSCNKNINMQTKLTTDEQSTTIATLQSDILTTNVDETLNMALALRIDDQIIYVVWLNYPSVSALKELAKEGLTISMHEYGGFEQTGMFGSTITSNDSRIGVVPGDIVFIIQIYNSSSWSYTKLDHIILSKSELTNLLGDEDVVITLK
ncbi:MAG: hypothetical protein J6Y28_00080 [Acholeplasmatales bacterium]|nr:hypothetical protein [Acholeplasmatales bacterium]